MKDRKMIELILAYTIFGMFIGFMLWCSGANVLVVTLGALFAAIVPNAINAELYKRWNKRDGTDVIWGEDED